MAFVSVPKDLTKVKNKVVLNLTKRQLLCLSIAAAMGLPFYFLTKDWIGTSNAATGIPMYGAVHLQAPVLTVPDLYHG